jgi:hypothetical protein
VRAASQAELQAVPGISARDAATVFRFFERADSPDGTDSPDSPDRLGEEAVVASEASERKPAAQKEPDEPI